jgi:hypothetical protein
MQKKQRFENTSLTWENGHAVRAVGVADPFLKNRPPGPPEKLFEKPPPWTPRKTFDSPSGDWLV